MEWSGVEEREEVGEEEEEEYEDRVCSSQAGTACEVPEDEISGPRPVDVEEGTATLPTTGTSSITLNSAISYWSSYLTCHSWRRAPVYHVLVIQPSHSAEDEHCQVVVQSVPEFELRLSHRHNTGHAVF